MENKNEQGLNVLDLLLYLLSKWKWFLLSVLIFGGLAWYKYASAPLVYFGKATVIIKDPSSKTTSGGLDRFDNYINKVNVANEILQFKSKKLMREVVNRINADISYKKEDGLRLVELYTQSPVSVSFPDMSDNSYTAFTLTVRDEKSVILSDFAVKEAQER